MISNQLEHAACSVAFFFSHLDLVIIFIIFISHRSSINFFVPRSRGRSLSFAFNSSIAVAAAHWIASVIRWVAILLSSYHHQWESGPFVTPSPRPWFVTYLRPLLSRAIFFPFTSVMHLLSRLACCASLSGVRRTWSCGRRGAHCDDPSAYAGQAASRHWLGGIGLLLFSIFFFGLVPLAPLLV